MRSTQRDLALWRVIWILILVWNEMEGAKQRESQHTVGDSDTEVISNVTARIMQPNTTLLPVGELGSCLIRLCGCQHWTNAKLYQMSLEDLASHIDHGPWNITHTQQYGFKLKQTTSPDCLERTLWYGKKKTYCFLVWFTHTNSHKTSLFIMIRNSGLPLPVKICYLLFPFL